VAIWYGRAAAAESLAEERESTVAGLLEESTGDVRSVTPEELVGLLSQPNPPTVLDVRTRSSHERDGSVIPGSARVVPDQIVEWAADCAAEELVVSYCS
jgi:hypothetical protein